MPAKPTEKTNAQGAFIRCHPSNFFPKSVWEGRFKSQALLDESAFAACMAYVDLNLIRANMAKTPEESHHTSIQKHINSTQEGKQPKQLIRCAGSPRKHMPKDVHFGLKSYLELVEFTGRCMREDKKGHIAQHHLPILERLNIAPENWLTLTTQFSIVFKGAVGRPNTLNSYCEYLAIKRRISVSNCERLLA